MNNYLDNQIFDNVEANQTIDLIFFQLDKYIHDRNLNLDLSKNLGLSGQAGINMQITPDPKNMIPIKSIVLMTCLKEIYSIFLNVVDSIPNTGVIKFQERVLICNDNFLIEFYITNQGFTLNNINGIGVQLKEEIDKFFEPVKRTRKQA